MDIHNARKHEKSPTHIRRVEAEETRTAFGFMGVDSTPEGHQVVDDPLASLLHDVTQTLLQAPSYELLNANEGMEMDYDWTRLSADMDSIIPASTMQVTLSSYTAALENFLLQEDFDSDSDSEDEVYPDFETVPDATSPELPSRTDSPERGLSLSLHRWLDVLIWPTRHF